MLLSVKTYLAKRKRVSLQALALHFKQQPETMQHIVAHWVRKGRVQIEQVSSPQACKTPCQACQPEKPDIVYHWQDS